MSTDLEVLGNLVLLSAIPGLLLFVLYYGIISNWRATMAGRALFWQTLSQLVVCLMFLVSLIFGTDWFPREYLRLLAYGFVSFTIWRMFYVLRRIQKGDEVVDSDASPR